MRLVLATLLAAGALAIPAFAAADPLPGTVTLDGVGAVVPGMTVAQLAAAWHLRARAVPRACGYLPFAVGRARGRALFVRGRLGAVFFRSGVRTSRGVVIGSTLERLRRSYGGSLQSGDGSHFYFLTRAASPHWQIRFDTNAGNRVEQIGFGEIASVQVVEGCP